MKRSGGVERLRRVVGDNDPEDADWTVDELVRLDLEFLRAALEEEGDHSQEMAGIDQELRSLPEIGSHPLPAGVSQIDDETGESMRSAVQRLNLTRFERHGSVEAFVKAAREGRTAAQGVTCGRISALSGWRRC